MKVDTKKVTVFLVASAIILSLSLVFRGNITGLAVFQAEVFEFPVYDYIVIVLIGSVLLGSVGVYRFQRADSKIAEELANWEVNEPNLSIENLKDYVSYCFSVNRSHGQIKEILTNAGWDNGLISEAILDISQENN